MNEPMTEAIARSIVYALSANFGPWEDDRRDLWVGKVGDLDDGEAAWIAAQLLIDNHEGARVRFAEFKTAYAGALRQLSERRSRERGLNRPERRGRPTWTYVWAWARMYRDPVIDRDHRFPQQDWWPPGEKRFDEQYGIWEDSPEVDPEILAREGRRITFMDEEEYDRLHSEWLAVGAPRYGIDGRRLNEGEEAA